MKLRVNERNRGAIQQNIKVSFAVCWQAEDIKAVFFFLYRRGRQKEGQSSMCWPCRKRARPVGKAARVHNHVETFLVTGPVHCYISPPLFGSASSCSIPSTCCHGIPWILSTAANVAGRRRDQVGFKPQTTRVRVIRTNHVTQEAGSLVILGTFSAMGPRLRQKNNV